MIIAVVDKDNSILPIREQITKVAEAKPDMIILLRKDSTIEEYNELAQFCSDECRKNSVEFCIDGYEDVAKSVGVGTIYLDLDLLSSQNMTGFSKILTTVHNEKEARDAESAGASILIFRDVFDTSCKSCRGAKGLATLRFLLGSVDVPVIGAGGIFPDVFVEVLSADVAGVCMKDAFMKTKDPSSVVKSYRDAERFISKQR